MKKRMVMILVLLLLLTGCGRKNWQVKFHENGGSLVSGQLHQKLEDGEMPAVPVIARDGYVFAGWDKTVEKAGADADYIAQWEQLCNVSFDPNGGTLVSGELNQQLVKGQIPAVPQVTMDGQLLQGWNPEIGPVEKDITYTAQWAKAELTPAEINDLVTPAVVEIIVFHEDGSGAQGSGFFVDSHGTILTNYHVIDQGTSGFVILSDRDERAIARVRDYSDFYDLAILEIDKEDTPFLTVREAPLRVGDLVYTKGSPKGYTGTFAEGRVTNLSTTLQEGVEAIQHDAPMSHGNSGGPLVDAYGQVVGVNTWGLEGGNSMFWSIKISQMENLTEDLGMTLREVYTAEYDDGKNDKPGFYGTTDTAEEEPNNTWSTADDVRIGKLVAGEVTGTEDVDFYSFSIDETMDILFHLVPLDQKIPDAVVCAVFQPVNDEAVMLGVLEVTQSTNDFLYQELELELEAGDYMLIVTQNADAGYELDDTLYYAFQIREK